MVASKLLTLKKIDMDNQMACHQKLDEAREEGQTDLSINHIEHVT